MRITLMLLMVLGVTPLAGQARSDTTGLRAELQGWYGENIRAFTVKNARAVMALRADDFHAILPDGTVRDRAEMERATVAFLGGIDRWIEQSFELDSLTRTDDLASAVVHQHLIRDALRGDGRVHRVETWVTQRETWRRTPAGWRLYRVDRLRDQRRLVDGRPE